MKTASQRFSTKAGFKST